MQTAPGVPFDMLVTGGQGRVGGSVAAVARGRGLRVAAPGRDGLDVTDASAVAARLGRDRPKVVVHCAAFTRVDAAERDAEGARRVNVDGTRHVAEAADAVGARFVYVSTDYVFDGVLDRDYAPDDEPRPLSVYGRTKAAGEEEARRCHRWNVVRTSWVFGPGEAGFAAWVARNAREPGVLRVVEDEVSRPTRALLLAHALLDLATLERNGIHHAACRGSCSRLELARRIVAELRGTACLEGVTAREFGGEARRPPRSVLDLTSTEEALGRRFAAWPAAVSAWLRASRGAPLDPALAEAGAKP